MSNRVSLKEIFTYFILLGLIILFLIDGTFKFVSIQYNLKAFMLIIAISILYSYIITNYKYGFISLALLIIIPTPFYLVKHIVKVLSDLRPFINSAISNQYITKAYSSYFISLMCILAPICIIVFYYITVIRKNTTLILVAGSITFTIYYLLGSDSAFDSCSKYLFFTFILFGYNNYMIEKERWIRESVSIGENYLERWLSTAIILTFVTGIMIKILPYDLKTPDIKWINQGIMNRLEGIGHGESTKRLSALYKNAFNLSYTGFQQDPDILGGSIRLDKKEVMRIYSDDYINELRLRGRVSDTYTGYSWQRVNNEMTKYRDEFDIPNLNIPSETKKIKIYPDRIYTTTIFNILYPYKVNNKWKYIYVDGDFEIFNPKKPRLNQEYEISFKKYNLNSYYLNSSSSYFAVNKAKEDFTRYLRLPNTIPGRVYKLAHGIADKYNTPYEKASAIENYLKKNYPYDLNTSKLPKRTDFVDYFMFTEKKGYCSYFATAMAVMCRIVGVPSRYVEGFFVFNRQPDGGYTYILNSDSHSWVELYFDSVGWVPFDPTPGNPSAAMDMSTAKGGRNNYESKDDTTIGKNNENLNEDEKGIKNKRINNKEDINTSVVKKTIYKFYILIPLILLLVLLLGYMLLVKWMSSGKRLIDYSFFRLTLCGRLVGRKYEKGDTAREYFKKLGDTLNLDMLPYINLFEHSEYNLYEFNEMDNKLIIKNIKDTGEKTKEYTGTLLFYIKDITYTYIYFMKRYLIKGN